MYHVVKFPVGLSVNFTKLLSWGTFVLHWRHVSSEADFFASACNFDIFFISINASVGASLLVDEVCCGKTDEGCVGMRDCRVVPNICWNIAKIVGSRAGVSDGRTSYGTER